MRILLVDDEGSLCTLVHKYAHPELDVITRAESGNEAIALCRGKRYGFDILLMDTLLSQRGGFFACQEIRAQSDIPILILRAAGEKSGPIQGFEMTADEYISRSFTPEELPLLLRSMVRKASRSAASARTGPQHDGVALRGLYMDFAGRRVFMEGSSLTLAPKEYELLAYLVKNRGVALTRERLLRDIWGPDYSGYDRTLDTHVKLLRRHLGRWSHSIVTLRGVGYRFDMEEE